MKLFLFFFLVSSLLTSCDSSSKEGVAGLTEIPHIEAECFPAQAPQCQLSNSGVPIFIGISDDLNINCRNYIDGILLSNLQTNFVASGFSVTSYRSTAPAAIIGTVGSWTNNVGGNIDIVEDVPYKYCGVIDVNSNNRIDNAEPLLDQEGLLSELQEQLTLNNWDSF